MSDEIQELMPLNLVKVGQYRTVRQANDDTLLILSMGVAYWMLPIESGYEVRVEATVAEEVIRQLEKSRQENRFWPRGNWTIGSAGVLRSDQQMSFWVFLPYIFVLSATHLAQLKWSESFTEAGRLDVQAVWAGHEWWRLFTALTLHADVSHLLGNLGFGCFFALFVIQVFGACLGWSLILFAGALANLANVWMHAGESYYAIGASTAVFAAVGLISGNALFEILKHRSFLKVRDLMVPVFVAIVILAWWGSSGENTDLIGHLMGLFSGLFLGLLGRLIQPGIQSWLNWGIAFFSISILIATWWLALM